MSTQRNDKRPSSARPLRPRIFWTIVKSAGLLPTTVTFVLALGLASLVVAEVEPGINSVGDAAWFLYAVVITIGLGDYTCVTVIGRLVTVILSIYSVFFLALITGTVVSYCTELIKAKHNESVAAFLDQLTRLPELSHEELVELSERIKRLK